MWKSEFACTHVKSGKDATGASLKPLDKSNKSNQWALVMEGTMSQKHKTVEDIVTPAFWPHIYAHTHSWLCVHIYAHTNIADTETQAHKQMAIWSTYIF